MKYHPDRNRTILKLKRSLKKLQKRMKFCQTAKNAACTTVWAIKPLKVVWAVVLAASVVSVRKIFSASLGIFSVEPLVGGRGQQRQRRGSDLRYVMELTLEEAVKGVKKTITFTAPAPCDACDGKGSENPNDVETCPTCHGAGQVRMQQGFFSVQQTCSTCRGQGKIIKNPCKNVMVRVCQIVSKPLR